MVRLSEYQTLLSRHRIDPIIPPPGPFPYLTSVSSSRYFTLTSTSPKPIRHLAFARPPPTGEFTDYTARYGALQEEDKLSFRQTLSALATSPSPEEISRVAKTMAIDHLLDLPSVSLSSGQTRRARIAAALLTRPVLLLLEDPMAGLDTASREEVSRVLGNLNESGDIRIVLVLRGKGAGSMPEWVTEICEVKEGELWIGRRREWEGRERVVGPESKEVMEGETKQVQAQGDAVVVLRDVSVSYGEGTRPVREAKVCSCISLTR